MNNYKQELYNKNHFNCMFCNNSCFDNGPGGGTRTIQCCGFDQTKFNGDEALFNVRDIIDGVVVTLYLVEMRGYKPRFELDFNPPQIVSIPNSYGFEKANVINMFNQARKIIKECSS